MDYRKLSYFILLFGLILVLIGIINYLNNLPLENTPSERFTWQGHVRSATILSANIDRIEAREQSKRMIYIGIFVIFVGVAVFASAKKDKGKQNHIKEKKNNDG